MAAKSSSKSAPESNVPVDYRTIDRVSGPLLFVREVQNAAYGEIVEISLPDGTRRQGQVLDSRKGLAIVQVFGPTMGMNLTETSVKFLGEVARFRSPTRCWAASSPASASRGTAGRRSSPTHSSRSSATR